MHYTPGQLRDALSLPKETFRYWRKELAVLAPRRGPRACFGPADLLATAIIRQVTNLGVPVGRLTNLAGDIFDECRRSNWLQLGRQTLLLQLDTNVVCFSNDARVPEGEATIAIPLGALVDSLRRHLLADDTSSQRDLTFPPLSVAKRVRS